MRKSFLASGVAAGLTTLLLTACGGPATAPAGGAATAACTGTGAHKAYLVIQHGNGKTVDRCIKFDGADASGDAVMAKSGIKVETQDFSFGKAVCALDREPASYDKCFDPAKPYWALWQEKAGGGWQPAQVGYTQLHLGDGDAMGWRYTSPAETSPAPPPQPAK